MRFLSRFTTTNLVLLTFVAALPMSVRSTVHRVDVGSFFFSPLKTTVQPGDTVRWVLISGIHTSTSLPSSPKTWNSGTLTDSFDVVFQLADGPGPFPYHCEFHPLTMIDTIFMNLPPTEPTIYPFLLDADQTNECNGTGSSARGFGMAILSPDSSELSLFVVHNVASPTGAHVHLGAPCVEGGIQFAFSSPTSPISESWSLTGGDLTNLLNGDLYVNIHSGAFPLGEIRGQIVQQPIKYLFTIDEAQADAGSGTGSFNSGLATCELSVDGTEFSIRVEHDIPSDSISDGHVHLGAPGVSGAIQFGFTGLSSPIVETWALDTTDIKNLFLGDLYINLHTDQFTAGEIRGQIERVPIRWAFALTGAEAGSGSDSTGICVCELNTDLDELSIYCEHNVANVTDGHVHRGLVGESGGIAFGFTSAASPISETWSLTSDDLRQLCQESLYVNIHSSAFPAGEIRGQIDPDPVAISFGLDEVQADMCNGTGSAATGTANVSLKPGGRELTIDVVHDIPADSAIDGHIHLGFPCVSGAIQFGFASPDSPIREIWYLSQADVVNYMQSELYTNVHTSAFPDEEIRGQLDVFPSDTGTACCNTDGIRGDADDDCTFGCVTVSDLSFLVSYLFQSGPEPVCEEEANADSDCTFGCVTVSDLSFLVTFLFQSGPAPGACP